MWRAEAQSVQRLNHCGGSAGASPEATETPKRIAEARREQLVFVRRFRGYRDLDMTPLRAVLGAGVRQHSAARVSVVGIVPSTAAGNPCPVLSWTAWRRCDSRLVGHSAVSSHRSADVVGVVERVSWT